MTSTNEQTPAYREEDGWLIDASNNRAELDYFGSREAAEAALASLKNCRDCDNCSDCSRCSGCSDCSHVAHLRDKENVRVDADNGAVTRDVGMPPVPRIEDIHRQVYLAVSQPNALEMSSWHSCETTHCRAGWVVHLAGEAGYALEKFHNTELAAMLIYRESGHYINPARFYDGNEAALEDMRKLAEAQA